MLLLSLQVWPSLPQVMDLESTKGNVLLRSEDKGMCGEL